MRPVLFFVAVFSIMLLALYLTVDMSPTGVRDTDPEGPELVGGAGVSADEESVIDLPFYDVQKGRLAYRLRGELPPDVFRFTDLQEPQHYVLHNGQLEIPIYDDVARNIPRGVQPITRIVIEFREAEYEKLPRGRLDVEERITLRGGGTGRADDGSVITFDDLEILIRKPDHYVYTIRTRKPIAIRNSLLEITSASGLDGVIRGDSDLERINFLPPVVTYVDPKSAELFSLNVPRIDGMPVDGSQKVAITCSGPLGLDRTADPPRIEFSKDVMIFPVAKKVEGVSEPGDTGFHCQRLALLIRDDETGPPEIAAAEATWEGSRVRAFHKGFVADGDTLRWRKLDAAEGAEDDDLRRSVAILDGRPFFQGRRLEFSADEARFRLAENRILLDGSVEGVFVRAQDEQEKKDPGDDVAAPPVPEDRWAFSADHVDVVFREASGNETDTGARRDRSRGAARSEDGERRSRSKIDSVSRFVATSETPDGLLVRSVGGEGISIRGRELTYDGETRAATVVGEADMPPRFERGESAGVADSIVLLVDDRVLRLDGGVRVRLEQAEIERIRELAAERERRQKETDGARGAPSESRTPDTGDTPPDDAGEVDSELLAGLDLRGDRIDIAFDESSRILSAVASSIGETPVELAPGGDEPAYTVRGPNLVWDHQKKTALMEQSSDADATRPELEFRGGVLTAGRILFDQNDWTADLDGGITVRGRPDQEARATEPPGVARGQARFTMDADRAEVEFFEWFRRGAPDIGSPCYPELASIRRIQAWAAPDGVIGVSASSYSAIGREATWDTATQSLRLFGEGAQEFRRLDGEIVDVLSAEEILYSRVDGTVRLDRNVTGKFHLESSDGGYGRQPVSGPGTAKRSKDYLVFDYRTDTMIATVRETADCNGLELVSLSAREKVFVECTSRDLKLHGDDLEYDHGRQELRVFSRDGRYQTLSQKVVVVDGRTRRERINKIDSREIRVWYTRLPEAVGAPAIDQVVVRFFDDVTAAFHTPPDVKLPVGAAGPDDEWKLRADYLGMRIVSGVLGSQAVQSAYAEGEVILTAGNMKAMAREAIYEEGKQQLILRGTERNKVQISLSGNKSVSDEVVILSQHGSRFRIRSRGSRSPDIGPVEFLRPTRTPR